MRAKHIKDLEEGVKFWHHDDPRPKNKENLCTKVHVFGGDPFNAYYRRSKKWNNGEGGGKNTIYCCSINAIVWVMEGPSDFVI